MENELILILNDGDTFCHIGDCYIAEVTSEGLDKAEGGGANDIPEDAIIREVPIERLWNHRPAFINEMT